MNKTSQEFKNFIETQLNHEQQQAVHFSNGPLLVVAGAGSGKTRVITSRISHLILNEGAIPSAIVALTFTNKAAQEMQHRIAQFLGKLPDMPFIGTFHSYCVRFLKKHQDQLSTPFFSILDEDDQQKILSGIITRNGLNKKVTAKQLSYQISLIKNQSINPEVDFGKHDHIMHEIYKAYEHEKRASKCLDFDDLLLETVRLLKQNPQLTQQVHNTIEHVLVDEYQDTNVVQHELLKMLTLHNNELAVKSICVVGDEDQSIYSWRGATVSNILNFRQDFKDTTLIKIEQNYRSVQPILEVANQIIINNQKRNPKNLWSTRTGTNRIFLIAATSEYQEADAISSFMKMSSRHNPNNTCAVLYRAHYQSRAIEEALIKRNMPYTIIGGIQFYERKEIKDMLAYLRLIVNPFDRTSLFRVINSPQRGLGTAFEEQFFQHWHQQPFMNFKDIAHELLKEAQLPPKKAHALKDFIAVFDHLQPSDLPSAVLEVILAKTKYLSYLKESYEETEAEAKIENIKELMTAIQHAESLQSNTVGSFLDDVALLQEQISMAKKEDAHAVVLMTLHAAKGLEFDHVCIAGLNEDLLPSSRSTQDPDATEEERRLLYVGITRARERLLLTYARTRHTYGQMKDHMPSRFIREIPTSLYTRQDIGYTHQNELDALFGEWIGPKNNQEKNDILTFGSSHTTRAPMATTRPPEIFQESWKKNQAVLHTQFGVGIIQEVDRKKDGKLYITANFKIGTKKIEASFLKRV